MQELLDEFDRICRRRPTDIASARAKGVKLVAYSGCYVPEALIYAAGAKPYPLWRGGEPEAPDAVLDESLRFLNPFYRSIYGFYKLGVDPILPMADLVAMSLTDCHIYRIAELIENRGLPIVKVGVPTDWKTPEDYEYYKTKVALFKDKLEEVTGNKITEESLKEEVEKGNQINALLREVDSYRKCGNPPITGLEFFKINHCTTLCDPDVAIGMLKKIVKELAASTDKDDQSDKPRLVVFGHAVAIGDYVAMKALEDSGCVIVHEVVDDALRMYEKDIAIDGDVFDNICRALYLEKLPSNNQQPSWRERKAHLLGVVDGYRVDGVVWYELLYDEIYDMEFVPLAKTLGEKAIPLLRLQTSYEYTREATGPLMTKVETFADSVKEALSA